MHSLAHPSAYNHLFNRTVHIWVDAASKKMVSCANLALDGCSGSDTFLAELLEINSKLEEEMGKLYYGVSANVEGASENLMARLQELETVRGAVKLLVTELLQLDKDLDKE